MAIALLAMALQLQTAVLPISSHRPSVTAAADSLRGVRLARDAQAGFERVRRGNLPWEWGGGDRCEVRLGRFCWWLDESTPALPPEQDAIVRSRHVLLATLDSLGTLFPGDRWLAGMRVHYRIDGGATAAADSAARICASERWWCDALLAYAAHARGDPVLADSAFASALGGMSDSARCSWTDVRVLLPGSARGRYEALPCGDRPEFERRYWLLSQPRLAAGGNEWHSEFLVRRVQTWLAERSRTPHNLSWGTDAEELLLRYGWPVAWGRVRPVSTSAFGTEPGIVGHDPSPSFVFSPREALLDSLASGGDEGWELRARVAESRYAPAGVRRIAPVAAQLARFRRGDSLLLAAAFEVADDSVRNPVARLAVVLVSGEVVVGPPDTTRRGTAMLTTSGEAVIAGVELSDSASATLARTRIVYPSPPPDTRVALSDLLFFRAGAEPPTDLPVALSRALAGDTVLPDQPLGIYWETYGLADTGESVALSVTVEREDRDWLRTARQRLRLADPDGPLRISWSDARPTVGGVAPHAITVDLGNLPSGRYKVTLTLTAEGAPAVNASRNVELRAP